MPKLPPRLSHTIRCAVSLLIVFLLWLLLLVVATNHPTIQLKMGAPHATAPAQVPVLGAEDPYGLSAPSPTEVTVPREDPPSTERSDPPETSRSESQPRSTTTALAPSRPSGGVGSGEPSTDDLDRLGTCESHQDPEEDTGNGYYGAFQFLISTWHSLGYAGLPTEYSYEDQRTAAAQLIVRSGWGQFPACARKLGKI